jgi:hypothetical protein
MSTSYTVYVTAFAARHYLKDFSKKYKGAWNITWRALERELQSIDALFSGNIAETIADSGEVKICKVEFRVAGTKQSRHGSGNRCIVAVHTHAQKIDVLLVYHKNHLSGSGNETAQWKRIVQQEYKEYRDLL